MTHKRLRKNTFYYHFSKHVLSKKASLVPIGKIKGSKYTEIEDFTYSIKKNLCRPLASVTISRIRLTVENIQGASRPPTSEDIRPLLTIIAFTVSRGQFHLVSRAVPYQTPSTSLHPPPGGRCRKAMLGVWCPRENCSAHSLCLRPQ